MRLSSQILAGSFHTHCVVLGAAGCWNVSEVEEPRFNILSCSPSHNIQTFGQTEFRADFNIDCLQGDVCFGPPQFRVRSNWQKSLQTLGETGHVPGHAFISPLKMGLVFTKV